ncbi:MAG: hypothetical protein WBI17_10925 [Clostridiaceae bacterium]
MTLGSAPLKFGATAETDAYLIAMIIPTLFIGLVRGSVTNTFITVYSGYMTKGQEEEGWRMTILFCPCSWWSW